MSANQNNQIRELLRSLPVGRDRRAKRLRMGKFREIDENGNGILSLAETDAAVTVKWGIPVPKLVINRAFHAARDLAKPVADFSDDYIDYGEFRVFMVYLQHYFDLHELYEKMDLDGDGRISKAEFSRVIPKLRAWGACGLEDPEDAWSKADKDGGGMILFDEFADWALRQGIADMSEDASDRMEAVELLKQQEANLASKDFDDLKHSRFSVTAGVHGQGALSGGYPTTAGVVGAHILKTALGGNKHVLAVTVHRANGLRIADRTTSDPYAVLSYGDVEKQTKTIKRNLNPIWNETLRFKHDEDEDLEITVFDFDVYSSDDFLGKVVISEKELSSSTPFRRTLSLTGPQAQGNIEISFRRER